MVLKSHPSSVTSSLQLLYMSPTVLCCALWFCGVQVGGFSAQSTMNIEKTIVGQSQAADAPQHQPPAAPHQALHSLLRFVFLHISITRDHPPATPSNILLSHEWGCPPCDQRRVLSKYSSSQPLILRLLTRNHSPTHFWGVHIEWITLGKLDQIFISL